MTNIYWADGFDTYPSSTELALVYSTTPRAFSTSAGRFGGGAPGSDLGGGSASLTKPLSVNLADGWYSMSFFWANANGSRACQAFAFSSAIGVEGMIVFDSTNFNVKAYRGTSTLLGTSSNNVFSNDTWYRVEVRYALDPSAGVVEVWINNAQVLNLTGQNTRNNSTATGINNVQWPGSDGVYARCACYIDDIAVSDYRLGDLRIARVVPTSDATPNNGTLSTGVNHWAVVDEAQYNTSDYTDLANTLNQEERFGVGALPVTPDLIYAVMPVSVRWKLAAGNAAAYNLVRSSSSETLGAYTQLTTSAQIQRDIVMNDPATGIAWDPTGVANMKLAYRVA